MLLTGCWDEFSKVVYVSAGGVCYFWVLFFGLVATWIVCCLAKPILCLTGAEMSGAFSSWVDNFWAEIIFWGSKLLKLLLFSFWEVLVWDRFFDSLGSSSTGWFFSATAIWEGLLISFGWPRFWLETALRVFAIYSSWIASYSVFSAGFETRLSQRAAIYSLADFNGCSFFS